MNPIRFFVQGVPKAQPRPKACRRGDRAGVYNPATANDWKGSIRAAAQPHLPERPISEPVKLDLWFILPRPKSHYGTGRNANRLKESAPSFVASKPDLDNLEKSVMDALTDAGMWADDSLVVSKKSMKSYGPDARQVGASITIERAG